MTVLSSTVKSFDKESFRKKMKSTSYAKFDAHKWYAKLNNSSLFALTTSSLLLIFISIFSKYALCPTTYGANTELFSLIVSIIMLVLSLVISLSEFSLKSERFLRSANEIMDLHDRLVLVKDTNVTGLSKLMSEYSVLRKSADNHQTFNYHRGRFNRKKEELNIHNENNTENTPKQVVLSDNDKPTKLDWCCYWVPILVFYLISVANSILFLSLIWFF